MSVDRIISSNKGQWLSNQTHSNISKPKNNCNAQNSYFNQRINRQNFYVSNLSKPQRKMSIYNTKKKVQKNKLSLIFKIYSIHDFYVCQNSKFMSQGKENKHPNIIHLIKQKRSIDEWSKSSYPSFKDRNQHEWKQRVMCLSYREKQLDQKLSRMLESQKTVKESLPTTLSEEKMVNSFMSSGNQTLQKYFQPQHVINNRSECNHRKDLAQIARLIEKTHSVRLDSLENLPQQKIIKIIKSKLSSILQMQNTPSSA